jgi:hypothetical protein
MFLFISLCFGTTTNATIYYLSTSQAGTNRLAGMMSNNVQIQYLMTNTSPGGGGPATNSFRFALRGNAYVGDGILGTIYGEPTGGVVTSIAVAVTNSTSRPVGGNLRIDVLKNGASFFTTTNLQLTLSPSGVLTNSRTGTQLTNTTLTIFDIITVSVVEVGATTPGGNPVYVSVVYKR